jgi:hypothetical protein
MLSITMAKIIKNMLNVLLQPLNLQVTWRPYLEALEDEFQAKRHCPACDGPLWCHRLGCDALKLNEEIFVDRPISARCANTHPVVRTER